MIEILDAEVMKRDPSLVSYTMLFKNRTVFLNALTWFNNNNVLHQSLPVWREIQPPRTVIYQCVCTPEMFTFFTLAFR